MMDGYTALLLMREKREREEAELTAPYAAEVAHLFAQTTEARRAYKRLEDTLRDQLLPHLLDQIGRKLGDGLYREVMKVVAHSSMDEFATFTLPTRLLIAADPQSIVGRIVAEWKSQTMPRIKVSAMQALGREQSRSLLDVRIPELRYRESIQC